MPPQPPAQPPAWLSLTARAQKKTPLLPPPVDACPTPLKQPGPGRTSCIGDLELVQVGLQGGGDLERRLPPELHDDALGLLLRAWGRVCEAVCVGNSGAKGCDNAHKPGRSRTRKVGFVRSRG